MQLSSVLPPELVWGVFTRLVGLVYLIAFGSLLGQATSLVGDRGIMPVGLKLAAMRRDFPGFRRFFYFPTLLWFGHSDRRLRALLVAGFGAGLVIVWGGPLGFWAMLVGYVVYLSFDVALKLSFPWECVFFEVAVLGLFLPEVSPLPSLVATSAPPPVIAWAYRLLLFRVVCGFGKFKFIGSSRLDFGYLRGFLVNQPLPTVVAWHAQRLPLWVLRLGLLSLFWVEIPGAFLTLFPNVLGLVGGAGILGLMVVINLSGNFGYFNWIVAALCVPLLDMSTPRAVFSAPGPLPATIFVACHTLAALLYFPFNSYVSQSWHRWPLWLKLRPRWLFAPTHVLRALEPLRLVHAFGVFPPKSMAPIRCAAIVEVSWDGESWVELEYTRAATRPTHRPRFIAPHLVRWDQLLIYETFGTTEYALAYSVANSGIPYGHATFSDAECLMQRVLEGRFYEGVVFQRGSFPRRDPPKLARMRVVGLRPTTPEERRRTGAWWSRDVIGPHYPARSKNDHFWQLWVPEPELFDLDDVHWKRRSTLGPLIRRARSGGDLTALVVEGGGGAALAPSDIDAFWSEFRTVIEADHPDYERVYDIRRRLAARYSASELHVFERVLGRLVAALSSRLEPSFYSSTPPRLDIATHYEFMLYVHDLVLRGREVTEGVFRDPETAGAWLGEHTLARGLYLRAIFRLHRFVWDAHKVRLLDMMVVRSTDRFPSSERAAVEAKIERDAKKLWGVSQLTAFFRARYTEPEYCDGTPERYPEFMVRDDGLVVERANPAPETAS
jgi:hypothetical protein